MWTAHAPKSWVLTQKDVAGSLLVALSGSFQTSPTFYLDPKTGVTYNVVVQAQQYELSSLGSVAVHCQ